MSKQDFLKRKIITLSALIESKDIKVKKCQSRLEKVISKLDNVHKKDLDEINTELKKSLENNLEFDFMMLHFEEIHPNFYNNLRKYSPSITNNDFRLASFLKMNLNNKEIAYLLNISHAGIKKAIQRLRQKMELDPQEDLRTLIISMGD